LQVWYRDVPMLGAWVGGGGVFGGLGKPFIFPFFLFFGGGGGRSVFAGLVSVTSSHYPSSYSPSSSELFFVKT